MTDYPLVSIITGYYNRKENLRESIHSVLDQDYPNFEYIVFDDCSTDGTRELLEKISDPRLKLIKHAANKGFVCGLVLAIEKAEGKYIAIHGAGDYSSPERIRKEVEFLEVNNDVGIVGCLSKVVNFENNDIRRVDGEGNKHFDLNYILETNNNPFSHGEVMYRKSIYEEVGGYNPYYIYGQDRDLWTRILAVSKGYTIDREMYTRFYFKKSVSKSPMKRLSQGIFSETATINARIKNNSMTENVMTDQMGIFYLRNSKKLGRRIIHMLQTFKVSSRYDKSFITKVVLYGICVSDTRTSLKLILVYFRKMLNF